MTASGTKSLAYGSVGLTPEDECRGDGSAIAMMPLNQAGLDAVNNTFQCPRLFSSYPVTKYLDLNGTGGFKERGRDGK